MHLEPHPPPLHVRTDTETDFSHASLPYPSTVPVMTQAPPKYALLREDLTDGLKTSRAAGFPQAKQAKYGAVEDSGKVQ